MAGLEQKTVELLDKAEKGVALLTDKLAEIGQQYGPQVVDAGLAVARIEAAQGLVLGVPLVCVAIAAARYAPSQFALSSEITKAKDERYGRDEEVSTFIRGVVSTGVGGVCGVWGLILTLDLWRWVGVLEPKLWIAHKILGW